MQLQTKPKQRYYTPEEYLEWEEKSQEKNEYRNGEIIPMVGGTTNHNQIAGNVYTLFPLNIDNQDYYVYIESVKFWWSEHNIYTYPDVMVIKDKPIYHGKSKSNAINPHIIIEVLSSSTEAYDRGDKFEYYRSLPTFQEYILIEQDRYSITQYIKQDNNNWLVNFYTGEEAILKLGSVNWEISLKDIDQRIDFETVEEDIAITEWFMRYLFSYFVFPVPCYLLLKVNPYHWLLIAIVNDYFNNNYSTLTPPI